MSYDFKYFTRNNESPKGKFLIYISYSHVDGRDHAEDVAQKLVDGFDCAVVLNGSPQERPVYENNENKHLAAANLVVFLATPKAMLSESVQVNDIFYARNRNIPIISLQPDFVNEARLFNLTGSPYSIKMNSNRYEELFRKIFSTLIIEPNEIEMLNGFRADLNSVLSSAECYAAGRACYLQRDLQSAFSWLCRTASAENSKTKMLACHMLGVMSYVGLGVRQSFDEASSWFTKSAVLAESSFMLGYMCESGEEKAVNYPAAVRNYTYAAEKGDSDAQYILGFIFYQGSGVEKNKDLALQWYTQSAKSGNAKAQYVLAVLYDIGNDVEQDHELAFELYKTAARQGHKGAAAAISDRKFPAPARKTNTVRKESVPEKKAIASKILTILSFIPGLIFFSFPFSLIGSVVSFFQKQKTNFYINLVCTSVSFISVMCVIIYFLT